MTSASLPLRLDIFGRMLDEIRRCSAYRRPSTAALTAFALVWGNPGYSASIRFLRRIAKNMVEHTDSHVLECGSGASTLLMAAMAEASGRRVISLEHDAFWAAEMKRLLKRFGLHSVELIHAPMTDYPGYQWYQMPHGLELDRRIGFVVCDGPPKNTVGGRYGLLPTLTYDLSPNCVILLDDTHRRGEQRIMERWEQLRPMQRSSFFALKGFTELALI